MPEDNTRRILGRVAAVTITAAALTVAPRNTSAQGDKPPAAVPMAFFGEVRTRAEWDRPGGGPAADLFIYLRSRLGVRIEPRAETRIILQLQDSRVLGTRTIANAIAAAQTIVARPPRILVNASAIGFYGNRGDEILTEQSSKGSGFLAELAQQWELATEAASTAGVRTVMVRIGVVLAKDGGALKAMLPAFRLGIGGQVSSGKQWMSWIALHDLVRIIATALAEPAWSGVLNAVAPGPVTNAEFSRTLAAVLHRPALFTVPAFAPKLIFGAEMVENTLLISERVAPQRLLQAGFQFAASGW